MEEEEEDGVVGGDEEKEERSQRSGAVRRAAIIASRTVSRLTGRHHHDSCSLGLIRIEAHSRFVQCVIIRVDDAKPQWSHRCESGTGCLFIAESDVITQRKQSVDGTKNKAGAH